MLKGRFLAVVLIVAVVIANSPGAASGLPSWAETNVGISSYAMGRDGIKFYVGSPAPLDPGVEFGKSWSLAGGVSFNPAWDLGGVLRLLGANSSGRLIDPPSSEDYGAWALGVVVARHWRPSEEGFLTTDVRLGVLGLSGEVEGHDISGKAPWFEFRTAVRVFSSSSISVPFAVGWRFASAEGIRLVGSRYSEVDLDYSGPLLEVGLRWN